TCGVASRSASTRGAASPRADRNAESPHPLRIAATLAYVTTFRAAVAPRRRRLVAGVAFSLFTIAACVLVGRRLTESSWPLAHTHTVLVAVATICYFASYVLRA